MMRRLGAPCRFAGLLALAAVAFLAGCDRAEFSTDNTNQGKPGETSALGGTPTTQQPLFQRIAAARQNTAFQGVRRVELHFQEGSLQRTVVVRERVSSDGHGRFAIEALAVLEPPMTLEQYSVFLSLQSLRQGMNWRYRDFSIDDLGLFFQNYTVRDTGLTQTVAGISAMELVVERADQSGAKYTLLVDPVTGLVVQAAEETHEGALTSEMTFETLALAPDLSGVAWHQSLNRETPLPATGSLAGQVGFEPRAPRTLPAGFQLLERSSVVDPLDGSTWVKATYSDGIESLFFLHGGPIVSGNGIQSGSPLIEADLVEVAVAAPWVVARGNLRGERVLALGKVDEAEVLALLRSAME